MALARAKSQSDASEAAVLAALTGWFASREAIAASHLPDWLIDMLVKLGVDRKAAEWVGEQATVKRLSGRSRYGSPSPTSDMTVARRVASEEPKIRARYVLAAARRLTEAKDRFNDAVTAELRYLAAHVSAGQRRRIAARRLDALGDQLLVWRTVIDQWTTPDCIALNGRLFTRNNPPGIPGAMHFRCRCTAEPAGRGPIVDWGRSDRRSL